jgi:hypothetical protein
MSLMVYLAPTSLQFVGTNQMNFFYRCRPPTTSERERRLGVVMYSLASAIESSVHFGTAAAKFTWAVSRLPLAPFYGIDAARKAAVESRIHLIRSIKLVLAVLGSLTLGIIYTDRVPDIYYRLSLVKRPSRLSRANLCFSRWIQEHPHRFIAGIGCAYVGVMGLLLRNGPKHSFVHIPRWSVPILWIVTGFVLAEVLALALCDLAIAPVPAPAVPAGPLIPDLRDEIN